MKRPEWERTIAEYLDGELEKERESALFELLASDDESREYFKKLNSVRSAMLGSIEEFPQNLEERILHSVGGAAKKDAYGIWEKNLFASVSYVVVLILLLVSIFLFTRTISYKEKLATVIEEVHRQNETIHLLYNSVQETKVESSLDYTTIVIAKM